MQSRYDIKYVDLPALVTHICVSEQSEYLASISETVYHLRMYGTNPLYKRNFTDFKGLPYVLYLFSWMKPFEAS